MEDLYTQPQPGEAGHKQGLQLLLRSCQREEMNGLQMRTIRIVQMLMLLNSPICRGKAKSNTMQ